MPTKRHGFRYAYQKAWVSVLCIGLKWRTAYALPPSFVLRTQVRRGEIQNVVFQRPKTYPKPVELYKHGTHAYIRMRLCHDRPIDMKCMATKQITRSILVN